MESEVALMNQKNSSKDLRKTITSNLEEVTKLESLVNSLLRLSRLEAGELRQGFTRLSSRSVAEAALKQVQALADSRHIKLDRHLQNLPVYGDSDSLVQLLVILLDNAIKYSPAHSTVSMAASKKDDCVSISVEDNGKGIEPVALEHVFDRFYRADKSRTKGEAEGYGLGLSIAKMIADLHDGTISLSSSVDHGTTATISIPLADDSATATAKP